jgi:hypothetical protein
MALLSKKSWLNCVNCYFLVFVMFWTKKNDFQGFIYIRVMTVRWKLATYNTRLHFYYLCLMPYLFSSWMEKLIFQYCHFNVYFPFFCLSVFSARISITFSAPIPIFSVSLKRFCSATMTTSHYLIISYTPFEAERLNA